MITKQSLKDFEYLCGYISENWVSSAEEKETIEKIKYFCIELNKSISEENEKLFRECHEHLLKECE